DQPLRLQAHLVGPLSGASLPRVSGRVDLEGFTFRHPVMTAPMEKVRASIQVDGEHVRISEFSSVMGGSDLAGNAELTGFAAPDVRFDLHSHRADFWELMSFISTEPDQAAGQGTAAGGSGGAAALLQNVTARGKLAIDEGSFQTLAFSSLAGELGLRGQVITLDPLTMSLYQGQFTGSLGLSQAAVPPTFRLEATAKEIDLAPLLSQNLDAGDMLSGRFSGRVKVQGAGTDYDTIVSSMRGDGKVEVRDGRVGQLDLLSILSRASGVFGEQTLQKLSRKFETEGTDFSRMAGSLDLAGGIMRSDDLRLDSPDLNIKGKTSINLMDETLDGKFRVLLSQDLSRSMRQEQSRAAEMFWDARAGRVDVPLTLAESYAAPTPNIDWQTATHNLARNKGREALKSRLGKFGALLDRGGESRPAPAPEPPAAADSLAGMAGSSGTATSSGTPVSLRVTIRRTRWSGNIFLKNLVVQGRTEGSEVDHLTAEITDASGKRLQAFDRLAAVPLEQAASAATSSAIRTWEFKVDGKRLVGADDPFTVRVVAYSTTGTTAEITTEVRK
ncbi:MAG: AsmA-like C-terminal region-containing protein, partial [Acidobacteriota bacterium]